MRGRSETIPFAATNLYDVLLSYGDLIAMEGTQSRATLRQQLEAVMDNYKERVKRASVDQALSFSKSIIKSRRWGLGFMTFLVPLVDRLTQLEHYGIADDLLANGYDQFNSHRATRCMIVEARLTLIVHVANVGQPNIAVSMLECAGEQYPLGSEELIRVTEIGLALVDRHWEALDLESIEKVLKRAHSCYAGQRDKQIAVVNRGISLANRCVCCRKFEMARKWLKLAKYSFRPGCSQYSDVLRISRELVEREALSSLPLQFVQ